MEKQLKDYTMNYFSILKILEDHPELDGFIEYLIEIQDDFDEMEKLSYEYLTLTGELELLASSQVEGLKVNKYISKELKDLIIIHNNNLRIERLKEMINK
jgi:hypothetical protein